MAYASYEQAIARKATSDGLVKYVVEQASLLGEGKNCLLYTSPSPRDGLLSRMPSSA